MGLVRKKFYGKGTYGTEKFRTKMNNSEEFYIAVVDREIARCLTNYPEGFITYWKKWVL